jgi:hypothetical protein
LRRLLSSTASVKCSEWIGAIVKPAFGNGSYAAAACFNVAKVEEILLLGSSLLRRSGNAGFLGGSLLLLLLLLLLWARILNFEGFVMIYHAEEALAAVHVAAFRLRVGLGVPVTVPGAEGVRIAFLFEGLDFVIAKSGHGDAFHTVVQLAAASGERNTFASEIESDQSGMSGDLIASVLNGRAVGAYKSVQRDVHVLRHLKMHKRCNPKPRVSAQGPLNGGMGAGARTIPPLPVQSTQCLFSSRFASLRIIDSFR